MAHSYIQVPPDSTGKKIHHVSFVDGGETIHTPIMMIGSADNSDWTQKVDVRGQAYTRFAEGSPTMDAFGNLRVAQAQVLGAYEYSTDSYADLFTDGIANGGAINYDFPSSETRLVTTMVNGSSAIRTSNRYHYYQPGVGNLIINTLALNDNGTANNVRRWGYFDDFNGLFWELDGTTLNVVMRSNTTGVVVEQRISKTLWNGDKLDGLGMSGFDIDLSKANFFFIDFAWLGVGAVRFGVMSPDGSRWIAHTFQNAGNNPGAYMAVPSMPIRFENFNVGPTAGNSFLKLICTAVYAESKTDYTFWRFSDIENVTPITVGAADTPLISMRPKPTLYSDINRVGLYPETVSVYVSGGPIRITIIDDATLTGASWDIDGEGTALGDNTATALTGGSRFKSWYLDPGCHNIDLSSVYETNDEGYHVLADGSDTYIFTLTAMKLNPASTVTATACLTYRELR